MSTPVALDTSALMMPVECNVRLFEELDRLLGLEGSELLTPQPVIDELSRLAGGGGTEGTAAAVGYELATERCLVVETEQSYADDALVELAAEGAVEYVVTNDRPLIERIVAEDISVIALRGKNKLAITQP